ncbi:NAD(P)-dependent alcohol dehydrogenase [Nocardia sp. CY15]|nr:NAD(P)-dependent alcohol dehydrogenase [Nocardia sp. CY15]
MSDGQQSTIERATMTAIVAPRYGSSEALRTQAVPRPVAAAGEVLVRVRAAAVCRGDVHLLTGKPCAIRLGFGLRRPKYPVIGHDLAGDVVDVGPGVSEFDRGDSVFGAVDSGAFAEFARVPVGRLARVPDGLTVIEAAALPDSGMTALQGLRDVGGLRAGQKVLVNGASGGVGTSAVQIAKALGADVTAVCGPRHVETLRALGADRVIDYTTADFTRDTDRYDVLLDLVGNRPLTACRRVLAPKGVFVSSAGAPGGDWLGPVLWVAKVVLTGLVVGQTMRPLLMRPFRADLEFLAGLAAEGKLRPVIERRFPLAAAASAVAHVAAGHAQGKTVIVV